MAASFPGAVKSFTTKSNGQTIDASHMNDAQDEIVAVETTLGVNPQGSAASVDARLDVSLAADGDLALAGVSTLTISGGVVTATGNRHLVDTEGSGATDDLDTINGGSAGFLLLLRIVNDGRNVVLTQAGNIVTPNGTNVTLDTTAQGVILWYDGGLSKWIIVAGASSAGRVETVTTKTGNYTATVNDSVIVFTSAATLTLPAATGSGRTYRVCNESTGNVTVDGNSSETIKGQLTQTLPAGSDLILTDYGSGVWC